MAARHAIFSHAMEALFAYKKGSNRTIKKAISELDMANKNFMISPGFS